MKNTPENALNEIFEEYKDQGLVSLYLYGSILTPDYKEGESDIDSIGFVNEDMPLALENEIKNKLCEKSGFDKFGFRFLYKSELDTGTVKGNLGSFIHPQLLLLDFPYWKHVAGKIFSRSDFNFKDAGTAEAVRIRLDHLARINDGLFKTHPGEKHILFSKVLARIIYHLQQGRGNVGPFSYSSVFQNSDEEERAIAQAILNCKKSKWDEAVFEENLALYNSYIDKLNARFA